jgi:ribosomal protein L29
MKKNELMELSLAELSVLVRRLRDELGKARLQKCMGEVENPQIFRTHRRTVARALTVMNAKTKAELNSK